MAFSKVKVGGLADDSVTAANIDDDGTGYTVGNLTNSGTLQQTGQATFGSGGTNWTLPTARGTDKYVLQINGTTGAADWQESLTAPEISGHNFDVSGSTDDGGINAYEAPYELTGTTNATTTISAINTTNLLVGQYISGAGIPADTTISAIPSPGSSGSITISNQVTIAGTQTGVALKIQKTPGEKNGGKVTLTGANFGATIGELTVSITNASGGVIANASYLSGLSGGDTITAEWTGTEGTYSTDLTSSYVGSIYFKITKSGLSSNVHNTNTTLTSDPSATALSGSSQTGGDRSPLFTTTDAPSASSLGGYGGRTLGGAQTSNTKLLLNFDRNGGTDIEDSSNIGGDGNKITAAGAAAIKASPFGDGKSAMFFDGSNDILRVGSSADFGLGSGAFTVEGWAYKSSATNASGVIFSTRTDSSGWSTEWQLRMHSNGYFTWFANGGGSSEKAFSNFSYALNTWYHFALVRDSNNTIELFINGTSRGTHTDSTNYNVAKELQIGAQYTSSSDNWFNGYLDELRIVKGTAVYTSDFDVPTSRLTAITNTKLLIHSNQTYDSSDSNHHVIASGAIPKSDQSKYGESSWYFDGSDDHLEIAHNTDFDFGAGASGSTTNDFTIECWFKRTVNNTSYQALLGKGNDTGNTQYTDAWFIACLLYTSPSPRDGLLSRMPSSA